MPRLVPSVLSTADLPHAELQCARLDGEVYPVDDCFSPIDEVPSAPLRATAVWLVTPRGVIAELATAAWIHGCTHRPPRRHTLCVDIQHRIRLPPDAPFRIRERRLQPEDLTEAGPLSLTTPLRTAIDLLRAGHGTGPADRETIGRLLALEGTTTTDCLRLLSDETSTPGNVRARRWILCLTGASSL